MELTNSLNDGFAIGNAVNMLINNGQYGGEEEKKGFIATIKYYIFIWQPISDESLKYLGINLKFMQKIINFIIKFLMVVCLLLLVPMTPWIMITYYSWKILRKYILDNALGPIGSKFYTILLISIIAIVLIMLFII